MFNKKYDNIIAIDPDVTKSGVAFLKPKTRQLELLNLAFPELLDYLQFVKKHVNETGETVIVIVEASWLISHNWHAKKGDSRAVSSAKGRHVGRNHEVGVKIVEMCKHYGLEVLEKRPLKKTWMGTDGKITHEEFKYFTNIIGRTNQETRDAGLLAWDYANLPIRVRAGRINLKF